MTTVTVPPAPSKGRAHLANAAALVLTLGSVLAFEITPRVFLFAFILTYAGQLVLLDLMLRIHWRNPREGVRRALEWLSRPPAPGQTSLPLVEENSRRALRLGGYLLVWGGMACFAFILAHVNAQHELDFAWGVFRRELVWALILTGIYLAQDLAGRRLTVDFDASPTVNLGYNSNEIGMLGCAVLFAGALVVARQSMGAGSSGWVVAGPLVALRHLCDLATDLRTPR